MENAQVELDECKSELEITGNRALGISEEKEKYYAEVSQCRDQLKKQEELLVKLQRDFQNKSIQLAAAAMRLERDTCDNSKLRHDCRQKKALIESLGQQLLINSKQNEDAEKKYKQVFEELKCLENQYKYENEEHAKTIEAFEKQQHDLNCQIERASQIEAILNSRISELVKERNELKTKVEHDVDIVEQYDKYCDQLQNRFTERSSQFIELEYILKNEIDRHNKAIKHFENTTNQFSANIDELTATIQEQHGTIEQLGIERNNLIQQIEDCRAQLAEKEQEQKTFVSQYEQVKNHLQQNQLQLQDTTDELGACKDQLNQEISIKNGLLNELAGKSQCLETYESDLQDLNKKLSDAQNEHVQQIAEICSLRRCLEDEASKSIESQREYERQFGQLNQQLDHSLAKEEALTYIVSGLCEINGVFQSEFGRCWDQNCEYNQTLNETVEKLEDIRNKYLDIEQKLQLKQKEYVETKQQADEYESQLNQITEELKNVKKQLNHRISQYDISFAPVRGSGQTNTVRQTGIKGAYRKT